MSKLGLNCVFIIKNGKHTTERIYSKKQLITKRHLINNNLSCCTGPAIIYITSTGLCKGYYYINGIEYTRENYKKFINNALNLKSFNKYKKLTTLENIKLVLETYNKTEQLNVLNKKIELLKKIAESLLNENNIKNYLNEGISYPKAINKFIKEK